MMVNSRLVASVLLLAPLWVSAFNPKRWSPYSGSGDGHYVISENAIERAAITYLAKLGDNRGTPIPKGTPTTVPAYCAALGLSCAYHESAVEVMTDANSRVDDTYTDVARYHFDAESFIQANTMLIKNKQAVTRQINATQFYSSARQLAGTILHSLQDFYSHSNWIEMGEAGPHRYISRSNVELLTQVAQPDQATCSDCNLRPGQFTCENNILKEILVAKILTSGYYGGQDIEKPPGVGKCSHGGEFDTTRDDYANGGVNKDVQIAWFSPHNYYQIQAVKSATDATYHFFLDLWDIVGDRYFGQFLALTDEETVVFVIENSAAMAATGSLQVAIDEADKMVTSVAQSAAKTKTDVVYVLVPFSGARYEGETYRSTDANEFRKRLRLLKPESVSLWLPDAMEAIKRSLAVAKSDKTTIYVFTDNSAKGHTFKERVDPYLKTRQQVRVNFLIASSLPLEQTPDSIELSTYKAMASATGGSVVGLKSGAASSRQLRAVAASTKEVQLLVVYLQRDDLTGKEEFTYTVDRTMAALILRAESPDGGLISVDFNPPAGVDPTKLIVTAEQRLPTFIEYTITSPPTGQWKLVVVANDSFSAAVSGNSDLTVNTEIGKMFTEDDHHFSGFISFEGEPILGINASVAVDIGKAFTEDDVISVKVSLLKDDGSLILTEDAEGDKASGFIANLTVPNSNFRVLTTALLKSDRATFQRTETRLYKPVPFIVQTYENDSTVDNFFLQVNIPMTLMYALTYYGNKTSETFTLSATDTLNSVEEVTPQKLTLGYNVTGYFTVKLLATDVALVGAVDVIYVYAHDTMARSNYVTKQLGIMPQFIDILAPAFTNADFDDNACTNLSSTLCHLESWSAQVSFADKQNGLLKYTLRILSDISPAKNGTANLVVKNFVPANTGEVANAYLDFDCCIAEVELLAVDTQGNLNSAYFSNVLKPDVPIIENGLEWWVYLLIAIGSVLFVGLLAGGGFLCYKKIAGK